MSKIKNTIIFTVIAILLILAYIFFIKPSPEEQNLVSSSNKETTILTDTSTIDQNSLIAKDLLSVLLSVKSIKLDDTIFSNIAFLNLRDSSISLTPLGDEGRLNPFAPIGFETVIVPVMPVITPPATPEPEVLVPATIPETVPAKTPSKGTKKP